MIRLLKWSAAACVCGAAVFSHPVLGVADEHEAVSAVAPDDALKMLQEGNTRYLSGQSTHPHADGPRREECSENGQHPFAAVLACSDSRVPIEILFDAGVGDVFVIRVAGNVCNVDEAGSLEYGVDHLHAPLLVVLGHAECGAVTAVATGAELHGNVACLVSGIRPAVAAAQHDHPDLHGKDLVPSAIESNVWLAIKSLFCRSPEVCAQIKGGKLKVVGAIYDLKSGKVRWLGEHPDQKCLLDASKEPGV